MLLRAREQTRCNTDFCNTFRENPKECHSCEYLDTKSSEIDCLNNPESVEKYEEYQSDQVCVVTVAHSVGFPEGIQVQRHVKPREPNKKYPTWRSKWFETVECGTDGCNYGNGQFGPYFGEETYVEPPSVSDSVSCQYCFEEAVYDNREPANDGCWANPYSGEFTQSCSACQMIIGVEYKTEEGSQPIYEYSVNRGCKAQDTVNVTQYGWEYECLGQKCNHLKFDEFDSEMPRPPGAQEPPNTTETPVTTTSSQQTDPVPTDEPQTTTTEPSVGDASVDLKSSVLILTFLQFIQL